MSAVVSDLICIFPRQIWLNFYAISILLFIYFRLYFGSDKGLYTSNYVLKHLNYLQMSYQPNLSILRGRLYPCRDSPNIQFLDTLYVEYDPVSRAELVYSQ